MDKRDKKISYNQKYRLKINKIVALMQQLFQEEDEIFNKITLKAKHHEST